MNIKHSKEEILKTGMELFRLNGYCKTGTTEILQAAGISRGSFYNFFKDKDDFGVQVVSFYTKWATDYMEELLADQSVSALSRLENMFKDFIQGYKEVEYKWGCLLVGMTQELGMVHSMFSEAVKVNFEEMVRPVRECIEQGQKKGEITSNYSAEDLAIFTLSAYNGALILMKSGQADKPLKIFLEQLISHLSPK